MKSSERKTEHRIEFEPVGRSATCAEGESLLEAARRVGLEITSICGGKGTCHRCRVQMVSGQVSPAALDEARALSPQEITDGYRLACQTRPLTDCRVRVLPESLSAPRRAQVESLECSVALDPPVRVLPESLSAPRRAQVESLECSVALDPPVRAYHLDLASMFLADASALLEMVIDQHHIDCRTIDPEAVRQFSQQAPQPRHVRASVRGGEVVAFGPWPSAQLGLAVDIGTTKIAAYLVDLDSGATLAARGIMNPQAAYGEDIITRLVSAREWSLRRKLQEVVIEALNQLTIGLCGEAGASPQDVVEAVLVGNTAMHHLALHLPIEQLLRPPFVPATTGALDIKARDLGLSIAPGAYAHFLPNVAGFVGADHVAMLLATKALWAKKVVLAIDIGTNTEVSLIAHGEIACVSCASGPAFEGGHIKHGMIAGAGAIERLSIAKDKVEYQTVDRTPPTGICGSGIIDAVAHLYSAGIVDASGRMQQHPSVRLVEGQREFVLVSEEERGVAPAITITQHDVREIQLAKAAIRTGIQVLLQAKGMAETDVEQVILAGAFGTYLDLASAVTVGMLPPLPLDRFQQVGNAAGAGARMALVSMAQRREVEDLARRIEYIELATVPRFMQIFARATQIGPVKWSD
jgi:uncharacterized 2Fe-2S/4Fe-4S cluster protein (DUF4445 family)